MLVSVHSRTAAQRDSMRVTAVGNVAAHLCMQEMQGTTQDTSQHLQKLLKPLLRALDWLLPLVVPPPPDAAALLDVIAAGDDSLKSAKRHADELRREHFTHGGMGAATAAAAAAALHRGAPAAVRPAFSGAGM